MARRAGPACNPKTGHGAHRIFARTFVLWTLGAILVLPVLVARAQFPQYPDGYARFENALQFDGHFLKRYVFRTRASSGQVQTFYREALVEQGWKDSGRDQADLLGTLLNIPVGDVLAFKKEDVSVSMVIMDVPGESDRMVLVNVMFPWPMEGGVGSFGGEKALYPSGAVTLRLDQPVGEGRVRFEQAECAEAPALVVPYAVNLLQQEGWQETGEMTAMIREIRVLDAMRFLSRGNEKLVILSASKNDKTGWLYSFVQYENLDIGAWRNFALAAREDRASLLNDFMPDPACGCIYPASNGMLSKQ